MIFGFIIVLQWNPSIADTIGDQHFVCYSEVSLNGGTVRTFRIVRYIMGACSTVVVMLLCVNIIVATVVYLPLVINHKK